MKHNNIIAHTSDAGTYPGFVSINQTERGMSITVRSEAKIDAAGNPTSGDIAELIVSEDEFSEMLSKVVAKFQPGALSDKNQGKLAL